MEPLTEIVQQLNHIPWRLPTSITPQAEVLIQEHIAKMRSVINYLVSTRGLAVDEAYAEAQSAGYTEPEHKTFMNTLFHDVQFRGAGVREHLILAITSYYFWEKDSELGKLENPWEPLMQLYKIGYTSSFEEEQGQTLNLLIGYQDVVKSYKLI
jgi:hypothetical protein